MPQLSQKFIPGLKYLNIHNRNGALHLNSMLYHSSKESHEEPLSAEWYEKAFLKMTKLVRLLKNVDSVDGRLVDVHEGSVIFDDRVEQKMHTFKSLARVFVGSRLAQQTLKTNMVALSEGEGCKPFLCFGKPSEREPVIVSSLTQVSNFLNITAQQRKVIRLTICQQVTQHRIWTGALEKLLNGLKPELDFLNYQFPSKWSLMAQQIVFNCLKFLQDTAIPCTDLDSTSWMRLAPARAAAQSSAPQKWEDVFEMFNDLIECIKTENRLVHHAVKLELMKEGLSQIKDVLIDKSIGYKEARHQESLVQKKLTRNLGYSSQCLFTLLLYYLYGHVRDIEVDLCGGLYNNGDENSFCLCMGRIVTSDEEKMVRSGVRHLDRALGLFKFVWETAGSKGVLDLQGHLWCVGGAEGRMLIYNGKKFFIHGICV
ncbi:hypothetical protein L484_020474 [Morus notabilis]|uniref:Uncharacterized protein n=2 Tax=Morus notabilis TaxID=981085 RepID=W9SBR7_9ROSA|nr:hypothetical protein L484_020474 [Morus notabilis]